MAKTKKSNETEKNTETAFETADGKATSHDSASNSEITNSSNSYKSQQISDLRVKLAKLNSDILAYSEAKNNWSSLNLDSEEKKQEIQDQPKSIFNIRVKPISASRKPKYSVKPWTDILGANVSETSSCNSKNETAKFCEDDLSLNLNRSRKNSFDEETRSQNSDVDDSSSNKISSTRLAKTDRAENISFNCTRKAENYLDLDISSVKNSDSGLVKSDDHLSVTIRKKFPDCVQYTKSPNLNSEARFSGNAEKSAPLYVHKFEGNDKLDGSYSKVIGRKIVYQGKELDVRTVPIGNKTPIVYLKDVLKLKTGCKKKINETESDTVENKNRILVEEMESKNLKSNSPQQAVAQVNQNNITKGKICEVQGSPLTSGTLKNVGKLIKMTKDSESSTSTKLLNLGDKKKVVILTVKKQESTVLKTSPKNEKSKLSSTNTLETTKVKELPELKKYLTLNTNVANMCSDVKDTMGPPPKETKTSPLSNTLAPTTGQESPRQGRRIRSPSIRYTDDMIVYPLKSPRKSRDTSKSSPNGSEVSADLDEKSSDMKKSSPKSKKKESRKEVVKVTVPCQTSHLYSLLTGEIKQLKDDTPDESGDKALENCDHEKCQITDGSSPQSGAVRALTFSEKNEQNQDMENVKSDSMDLQNNPSANSSRSHAKSTKNTKVKGPQTVSNEDNLVTVSQTVSENSSNLSENKDSSSISSSVESHSSTSSQKSNTKSPKKEKSMALSKEGKSGKSPSKNAKKKSTDKISQDKIKLVGSSNKSGFDDSTSNKTAKAKNSKTQIDTLKTSSDYKSEQDGFHDLIGRDVIKVNNINTKLENTQQRNVEGGLFGLIAKLENNLTSRTQLPQILTDTPYHDSVMLNEEENSDEESIDSKNDMLSTNTCGSDVHKDSPDILLGTEINTSSKYSQDDLKNIAKTEDSVSDKKENSFFDKPIASPDVILVDSATSSSKEEFSSGDKTDSVEKECDSSKSDVDKVSGSEVGVCPPDSTTNVVESSGENKTEFTGDENKEKGLSEEDTEENKSGENIGSRNLFDDFLTNIASPRKDGQKKEEKLKIESVDNSTDVIVKNDDGICKTLTSDSDMGGGTKNSNSDPEEDEDVIIVKVDQKKETDNKSKSSVNTDSMNKFNVVEQIQKKFHVEQDEMIRKPPVTKDVVYDLTDDSDLVIIKKEHADISDKTLKKQTPVSSSVIQKKKWARKTVSPAPLDVLMRVEMETTNSLSAFTSENLDEFLRSVNNEKFSDVIEDNAENDLEETDEMELQPEYDPDFDEVDGLLFMSFTSEDALNAHVHVERKTNIGKNENLLLGMSRIKRLRQQQRQLPSKFQSKFNRLKKLKIQSKINQNLRGMHKALSKYQRLYRLQLEKVFTDKGLELPVRPVVKTLQKTSDVTKIKGWKNKYGNTEEFAEATGLPLTKSGKFHWRTEERLLKNLNSQELKEIGLNLKKKRRKNLIFTVRKGMSKGDKTSLKASSSNVHEDDDSEEEEEYHSDVKTDDEDMNDDYWFPKYDDANEKNKKSEIKINPTKQRLAIKRLNLDPEDVEVIRKLGGAKTKLETLKEPGLGTYLSPSGRVVKRRRKRRKILHLTTMTHSMALAALKALDPKFVKPKPEPVKTPSSSVKKESTKKADNNTTPVDPLKPCDKPGCRYGCICHLCRLGDQSSDPEMSGKSRPPSCDKEYCRLGCICDSIEKREKRRLSSHCGKAECMFQCVCGKTDDLKKKLFSPNSSRSDPNDSNSALDQGMEEAIPSLCNQDSGLEDITDDKKSRKQDSKTNLPKRKPTYRLAKNLDAISRKAMLLYETSEMYTEMKARKRKSRDSSLDGSVTVNKAATNGNPPTYKTNQLKTPPSSTTIGKKGGVWKSSFQPCSSSSCFNEKRDVSGSDLPLEFESDEEEIKEDLESCARTTAYNPLNRKSSHQCTCASQENHSHGHSNSTKSQPSGEASSPVVISPVNSRPSTPDSSADHVGKEKEIVLSSSEKKQPLPIYTDMVNSGELRVTIPVPKQQSLWHTQWVCLKANKKKLEEEGQPAGDGVRLLEINSNCNWEVNKQKILSRISAQLSKEGYPAPQRLLVGDFCIEFLRKSNKPAVIPPEVRAKLPVSIYSVRINIMKITNVCEQQNPELTAHRIQNFNPTQEQIFPSTVVSGTASIVASTPSYIASTAPSPLFKPFRISNRTKLPVKVQIAPSNEQVALPQNSKVDQEKTSPLGIPSGGISGFSQLQIKNVGQHKGLVSSLPLATQSFILNSGNPSEGLIVSKTNGTLDSSSKQNSMDQKSDNSENKLAGKAMYVGSVVVSNTSCVTHSGSVTPTVGNIKSVVLTSTTNSLTVCTSVPQTLPHAVQLKPGISASTFVVSATGLKSSPVMGVRTTPVVSQQPAIVTSQEERTTTLGIPQINIVSSDVNISSSSMGLNVNSSVGNIGPSNKGIYVSSSGVNIGPIISSGAGNVCSKISSSGVNIVPASTTGLNVNISGVNICPSSTTGLNVNSSGVNIGLSSTTGLNVNSGGVNISPSSTTGLNINSSGVNIGPNSAGIHINSGSVNINPTNTLIFKDKKLSNPRIEGLRQGLQNILKCNVQETQKLVKLQTDKDKMIGLPHIEAKPQITGALGTLPVTIYGPFDSPMTLPASSNVKLLKAQPVKAGNSPVIHLVPVSGSQKFATHLVVSQSSHLSPMTRMTSPTPIMTRPLLTTSSLSTPIPAATPPASRELIAVPVNLTPMNMKPVTSNVSPFIPVKQGQNPPSITIPYMNPKNQISILPKLSLSSAPKVVPPTTKTLKVPISKNQSSSNLNQASKLKSAERSSENSEDVSGKSKKEKKKRKKQDEVDEKGNDEDGKKKKKKDKNESEKKNKRKKKDGNNDDKTEKQKKKKKKKTEGSEVKSDEKDLKTSNENSEETKSCEKEEKIASESVQMEEKSSELNSISNSDDIEDEPPLKRHKSLNKMGANEINDVPSTDLSKENNDTENNALQIDCNVLDDRNSAERKTKCLEKLIKDAVVDAWQKNDVVSEKDDDDDKQDDEMVASDLDEMEMTDEVDSMKSSGSSSLVGKNLLQSVEKGAEQIRNIVQNVNHGDDKQENFNLETADENDLSVMTKRKVSDPAAVSHFLASFMEQDNSNSSCSQSDLGNVDDKNSENKIATQVDKSGESSLSQMEACDTAKSVKNDGRVTLELNNETSSPTKNKVNLQTVNECLNSDGCLSEDASDEVSCLNNAENSEVRKSCVRDLADKTNDSADCDNVFSGDNDNDCDNVLSGHSGDSVNCDNIESSALKKNPNRDIKNKGEITVDEERAHLQDSWKEVGDLGAVINISDDSLVSSAIEKINISKAAVKDGHAEGSNSDMNYRSVYLNKDCDESNDVEIISFDEDENTAKQTTSVNSTGSRKRKLVHTVRDELPCSKVIKRKEDGNNSVDSPEISIVDSDEENKDLQSEPSLRDSCSIIDDCEDNDNDAQIIDASDDEDIDIESFADTDNVYQQLRAQAKENPSIPNVRKHSCTVHSAQVRRKRKSQLEVIHNSLQDDVEYREENIWVPMSPKNKQHNYRERQRRIKLTEIFSEICKMIFDEAELNATRLMPKIKTLQKLRDLIETLEKEEKKLDTHRKYHSNRNTVLKLRVHNLKAALRKDGVSEANIQGHLQKVAFINSQLAQTHKIELPKILPKVSEKEPNLTGKSSMITGGMEVPVRLIPIQASDLPNVKISEFKKTSPQIAKTLPGSIISSGSPLSASYSSPVPVQMVSSQQVKQMAAANLVKQETSSSKDPDIYIDYADEEYEEEIQNLNTDFPNEGNKLSDIGELPDFVLGSEKFVNNDDDISDTDDNLTEQNVSTNEKKDETSVDSNERDATDLKLTPMLIESTGELIHVELREDGQTSEQTDDEEQMLKSTPDNYVHVESTSDSQDVADLLAGNDT